ncbi:MAG TPA: CDP-diacylglycerol--glycerol-3-phosphate 3-phosphatidyltransferase [Parvularculaceae bacterium]|nr:CDP-diacylglycerol--glycerol-3-phosphate 3-phosphatidyltransferase [Parvularculaceae bacterium]
MANLITLSRIILVLPFAAMFFIDGRWAMTAALGIFVLAAVSDFLDGWIARARKETSALGAALDPLADKLLVAAGILLLVKNGVIRDADFFAALIILLREMLVGGLREALAPRGVALKVSTLAKWKTAAQLVAIALYLAAAPGGLIEGKSTAAASAVLWFAALLTVVTGYQYVKEAVRLLRAEGG